MTQDKNGTIGVVFVVDKFTSLKLPDAATVIEQHGCAHLSMCEEIECRKIARLETYAFRYDTYLKNITFGAPLELIRGQMVEGCKNLTRIDLIGTSQYFYATDGVLYTRNGESIEIYIYPAAKKTATFQVKKSMLTIEGSAFYQTSVSKFTVESGHSYLCVYKDAVYNKDKTILACPSKVNATAFKFPSTLTEIGDRAMYGLASQFSSLKIPEKVTRIGEQCMAMAKKILAITLPSTLVTIGKRSFHDTRFTKIIVPSKVTDIPTGFCTWSVKLETVEIKGDVTRIGSDAFSSCTSLVTINLPDTIIEIRLKAFELCTSLRTIKLPENLELIGSSVFGGCNMLEGNVIVPAKVRLVDARCFYMCDSITLVTIMNCNTEIGPEALFTTRGSIQSTCIITRYFTSENYRYAKWMSGLIFPIYSAVCSYLW